MASVKVAVRVRPFSQREIERGCTSIIRMEGKRTGIINPSQPSKPDLIDSHHVQSPSQNKLKEFLFDHSYWSCDRDDPGFVDQVQIYQDLGKELVNDAFEGYNACIFAYGQTGSGKTFTMMGTPGSEGLIPRICAQLFQRMKSDRMNKGSSFRTEVSYLEIYNERVKDLLSKNMAQQGAGLKVREHPKTGPYVENLSKHLVTDYSDVQELMARGNAHRTTAATGMNDTSSRSHAIFTVAFSQASFVAKDTPHETLSKVNLVDLAGSERANATGATGQRLVEGGHINKSLVTLGSVIKALAEHSSQNGATKSMSKSPKSIFIPYRDSVLTWLLKDSLGGNSKTVMIAAISPADIHYAETLSTLRYASRAKAIINKPTINEDQNTKLIRDLRNEIERLKLLLVANHKETDGGDSTGQQDKIEKQVLKNEAKVQKLTEEWTEKWKETQRILKEQKTLGLRKSGLGVVLDSEQPHLVGIDDDRLSTGITLYHLRPGQTKIGTEFAEEPQDICLNGPDIEDQHCIIEFDKGRAILRPLPGAQCFVNTIQIVEDTPLSQGCVILLGTNNVFRYNDPLEVEKLRREHTRDRGSTLNLSNMSRMFSPHGSVRDLRNMSFSGPSAQQTQSDPEDDRERLRSETLKLRQELRIKNEHLRSLEGHGSPKDRRVSFMDDQDISHDIEQSDLERLTSDLDRERDRLVNRCPADSESNCSSSTHSDNDSTDIDRDIQRKSSSEKSSNQLEFINEKFEELRTFEERLKAMELQLKEQQKELLSKQMNDPSINELIEEEVSKRLSERQTELEQEWRSELERTFMSNFSGSGIIAQSTPNLNRSGFNRNYDHSAARSRVLSLNLVNESVLSFNETEPEQDDHDSQFQSDCIVRRTPSNNSRHSTCASIQTDPVNLNHGSLELIAVPQYILVDGRGGCDQHHVYEVLINLEGYSYIIHRRYKKFRELHAMIRKRYGGTEVASALMPIFPPTKWWGHRSEWVAEGRRKCLEKYLQRLMIIGQNMDGCPLNWRQLGQRQLEKDNLTRFSSFFSEDRPSQRSSIDSSASKNERLIN